MHFYCLLPVPSQNLTHGRNRGFRAMSGWNHQACSSGLSFEKRQPPRHLCRDRSIRGERRGFLLDRGLLGHGRCCGRSVPLDRLRLARHRTGEHLVHARDRNDVSRPFLMLSPISTRSLVFSSGMITVLMPPRKAASSFSLRPAIGHTWPRSVISPVNATSRRTGMPVITETIAVAMATPAEGPSFGVAPSGTCTWMSRLSNKGGLMPKASVRG